MDEAGQKALSVKIVTGIALSSIVLYAFAHSTSSVLINEVVDGFSLSGVSEGLMSSVFGLGTMLAVLIAPLIQGRIAKMTVFLSATALQAVSLALCGISPAFSLFCVSCALLGAGGGLVDAYANSLLVDVHRGESARYLGYLHGSYGAGSLLAPLLILLAKGWVGWRGAFFLLAALLLIGLVALRSVSGRAQPAQMRQATREQVLRWPDLLEYVKNRRNMAVLAATVFAIASQAGVLAWTLRYMALRFDAEALGATALSAYWVCATVNRFTAARLRPAPLRLFIAGALLGALCLGAGVLSGSAWGMCAAVGGFGLCTGHFIQILFSECAKGYEGKTTFATSAVIMVMGLTRSVTPLAVAGVSAWFSVSSGMLIPAVMAAGAAAAGLALTRIDAAPR